MISSQRTTGADTDFQGLVSLLDADLKHRYGALQAQFDVFNASLAIDHALVVHEDRTPVGCGAFKPFDPTTVEIKRVFVRPESRGSGIASRLVSELETWAHELGNTAAILETGRKQFEAIALYTRLGYRQIENFGQYAGNPNSLCFWKSIQ